MIKLVLQIIGNAIFFFLLLWVVSGLLNDARFFLIIAILCGICALFCLVFYIRNDKKDRAIFKEYEEKKKDCERRFIPAPEMPNRTSDNMLTGLLLFAGIAIGSGLVTTCIGPTESPANKYYNKYYNEQLDRMEKDIAKEAVTNIMRNDSNSKDDTESDLQNQ